MEWYSWVLLYFVAGIVLSAVIVFIWPDSFDTDFSFESVFHFCLFFGLWPLFTIGGVATLLVAGWLRVLQYISEKAMRRRRCNE